jgi:hypothetical protein
VLHAAHANDDRALIAALVRLRIVPATATSLLAVGTGANAPITAPETDRQKEN